MDKKMFWFDGISYVGISKSVKEDEILRRRCDDIINSVYFDKEYIPYLIGYAATVDNIKVFKALNIIFDESTNSFIWQERIIRLSRRVQHVTQLASNSWSQSKLMFGIICFYGVFGDDACISSIKVKERCTDIFNTNNVSTYADYIKSICALLLYDLVFGLDTMDALRRVRISKSFQLNATVSKLTFKRGDFIKEIIRKISSKREVGEYYTRFQTKEPSR